MGNIEILFNGEPTIAVCLAKEKRKSSLGINNPGDGLLWFYRFQPPSKNGNKKRKLFESFFLIFFSFVFVCLVRVTEIILTTGITEMGWRWTEGGGARKLYTVQESAKYEKKGDPFRSVNGNWIAHRWPSLLCKRIFFFWRNHRRCCYNAMNRRE